MADPGEITHLLSALRQGDAEASERLVPLVYDQLKQIARAYMRSERPDHTLQPTALVNEAYLRLVGQHKMDWQNRAHFFGVAAHLMRLILVDHAREKRSQKRGGGRPLLRLEDVKVGAPGNEDGIIAIHQALEKLSLIDPRLVEVVELRFFVEMSLEQTAEVLSVSTQTVKRDWRLARSWLADQLSTSREVR